MTNTHRKTTNRATAKIAAVGAFGIGAAIAFPGLAAAAPADAPVDPTASLAEATGEDGSLQGALGTELNLDLGSLTFNLNLDAETPNPGSLELGSLGVSPNTGSALIDNGSGPGSGEDSTQTGAATGSAAEEEPEADVDSGSLGSGDETTTEDDESASSTGSLSSSLAGLSSDTPEDEGTEPEDTTGTTDTAGVNATADGGLGSLG
ncbi:hypothetical protein [Dietzia sp. ANT_WB102]|uniref:hypothetical protein n=1 Tax=Dietzia sp. ANT_WB102 TaxID=2597345 RepID=UPI0011EEA0BD|nr:hypothetical protein [Dietzia sp. ANT_WB102]KAA0918150.1 hypothetical protein FQ137_01840 [Dietzia sp. ANT_WB102]